LNLVRGLEHLGRHQDALAFLGTGAAQSNDRAVVAMELELNANAIRDLGDPAASCPLYEEALKLLPEDERRGTAAIQMEAGKAYSQAGNEERALELWRDALQFFEADGDLEHVLRVRANISWLSLKNGTEEERDSAVVDLEDLALAKLQSGDLSGAATNYCNLSLYFASVGRFERALAYARKDLSFTRTAGNQAGVAVSLMNMGVLYLRLNQPTLARRVTREARDIAETLRNDGLRDRAVHNLDAIEKNARAMASAGEVFGPSAPCQCGSGKEYRNCCGVADFDPPNIMMTIGRSEARERITKEYAEAGLDPSHLDFVLRDGEEVRDRRAWRRMHVHDGWLELFELPDLASIQLGAARSFADGAQSEDIAAPMAALIMSACALESFINQVIYFVSDQKADPGLVSFSIPPEILKDPAGYQRTVGLHDKWNSLALALFGSNYRAGPHWKNFDVLIRLRNEMVHFKAVEYERIVPKPDTPHAVIRALPSEIETRDLIGSWPIRVLTPSLAKWCVATADSMITWWRSEFRKQRIHAAKPCKS
jgi:tetratricopeptide (TPR) repeat protein